MGWVTWNDHMRLSHGMGHMGWSHGMVTWDGHMGLSHGVGHMGWSHGMVHMGWSRKVVSSKLGDIQNV